MLTNETGVVGNDARHPEVDQLAHPLELVDRPREDLQFGSDRGRHWAGDQDLFGNQGTVPCVQAVIEGFIKDAEFVYRQTGWNIGKISPHRLQ